VLVFGLAAAIAILLLLQAAFRSWPTSGLAFVALPLALVGGVLAALIDGAELTLGAMIALLALFALATRHSVVLIRRFQDLEREGERFGPELVERGAQERLGPILTGTSATALAMLPFALAGAAPGLEIVHPMAIVVLGGLVTSTLLNLFLLPALYARFGRPLGPDLWPEDELLYRWAGIEPEAAEREPAV
jgi:Cu/Ag efflux pump CusA